MEPVRSAEMSLGQRLRAARDARGLTIEEAAARLKLPAGIVVAMENDDAAMLGAPVFARGRLGNYAKLLGVPVALVESRFAPGEVMPPPLASTARDTRFERGMRRVARQGVYVALTATIVLPVLWLATRHELPHPTESLAAPTVSSAAHASAMRGVAHPASARSVAGVQAPVAASLEPFGAYRAMQDAAVGAKPAGTAVVPASAAAPLPAAAEQAPVPAAQDSGLQLRFSGDTWVELIGVDGRVIERGMIEAGSVRDYRTGALARIAIGNVDAVRVLQGGQPLDLTAYTRANVARFTLSSDGKPAPAGG